MLNCCCVEDVNESSVQLQGKTFSFLFAFPFDFVVPDLRLLIIQWRLEGSSSGSPDQGAIILCDIGELLAFDVISNNLCLFCLSEFSCISLLLFVT